jgi:hypothetical protein
MDDQTTAKVTEVRVGNLREVHRKTQGMLPAQVELESIGCFLITDVRVALKQKNSRHHRRRMRRAPLPISIHLGEVLVAKQTWAELMKNPVCRTGLHLAGHLRRSVHQVPLILTFAHRGPGSSPVQEKIANSKRYVPADRAECAAQLDFLNNLLEKLSSTR